MYKHEQLDVFYENDPELKYKARKAHFRISILGGQEGAQMAEKLGYELTKDFYSIQTGGYNSGSMKAGLEGANRAIEELSENPETKKVFGQIYPFPKGIVAERFAPEFVPAGEHIKTQIEEGEMDIYKRLGELNEHSSAVIMLPGDTGTEVELLANLHFDKKLKERFSVTSVKPLIFIGDSHMEYVKDKFKDTINNNQDIYKVNNENAAHKLINILEKLQGDESLNNKQRQELIKKKSRFLLKFKDNERNNE